jgi:predicted 3-demethylubiquinone-9 3-methyltransferase (glyoxalase superfamily)
MLQMLFNKTLIVATLGMVGVLSAMNQPRVHPPDGPSDGPKQASAEKAGRGMVSRERGPDGANKSGEVAASVKVTTLFMFYGNAEEAMKLYTCVIPNSKVTSIERYGKGGAGAEGTVMHATFTLNGQEFQCIDSPPKHGFTFTPATSLSVTCENETQIEEYFVKLSKNGKVFMPLEAYPFAKKFVWFADRFGV